MNAYKLRITTPSEDAYDGEALQISLRVTEGDIAIMAGHIPFVSAVVPGKCRVYLTSGDIRDGRCSGGLLSVTKENVRLLCSEFEWDE
jgi:F-type H+-transporting ATPase subunit epsilon